MSPRPAAPRPAPPRSARPVAALLAVVLACAVLPACGQTSILRPDCTNDDPDTLVVVAQSVPTADLVPCLASMPAGWSFQRMEVGEDHARMVVSSDRGGPNALSVTLLPSCDLDGAKRIPSDEAGAQRYERVRRASPYAGTRFYEFSGGCVTYEFDLAAERSATLLNEASLMVDFTTREVLRRRVVDQSEGVITDAP